MKTYLKGIIPEIKRFRAILYTVCLVLFYMDGFTQNTISNKIKLIKVEPSQCDDKLSAEYLQDRIISKEIKGDTLFLHLGFSTYCCFEFNVEISYKNNLLDIDLDNRRGEITVCACDCCYELRLTILGIKDSTFRAFLKSQEIFLDKEVYKTYPEKFEIVDGDTINRINKYGFKEGFWRTFYKDTSITQSEIFYHGANDFSEEMIKEGVWSKHYFKNGNLSMKYTKDTTYHYYSNGIIKEKEFLLKDGYILEKYYSNGVVKEKELSLNGGYVLEMYHPNGQMKSNCREIVILVNGTSQKSHSCKYWNEKGEEIKQE